MPKYPLGPGPRKARIQSKINHPSWNWQDQWTKVILTDDMLIFRSEVLRRLQGGAEV